MADADPLAAALTEIRERSALASDPGVVNLVRTYRAVESAGDVPRLLAAVEAALEVASRWKGLAAPGDAQDECADDLRAAITRALLGEEAPDGA